MYKSPAFKNMLTDKKGEDIDKVRIQGNFVKGQVVYCKSKHLLADAE